MVSCVGEARVGAVGRGGARVDTARFRSCLRRLLLDHDLGQRAITEDDESPSGTDVALALVQHFSPDIPILIHSTNQVQVPRVVRQLEELCFWVTRLPFYDMSEERFRAWAR